MRWTGWQVLCQGWPRRHEATNAKPVNIGFPKEILTRVLRNTNQECQPLDWNVLISRPQLFRNVRHSTAMLHWFAATPIYKASHPSTRNQLQQQNALSATPVYSQTRTCEVCSIQSGTGGRICFWEHIGFSFCLSFRNASYSCLWPPSSHSCLWPPTSHSCLWPPSSHDLKHLQRR